jgi:hypothetical protein
MRSAVTILILFTLPSCEHSNLCISGSCTVPFFLCPFLLYVRCIDQPASDLVLACKQEVQWIVSFFLNAIRFVSFTSFVQLVVQFCSVFESYICVLQF